MEPQPELDLKRLHELETLLDAELPAIVRTLLDELTRATDEIEAAMARGDLGAVALATHAARNSGLMLDARPLLGALADIETGARDHDRDVASAGLASLRAAWPPLRHRLEAEAATPD
jgi:hypothetical protein